MNNQLSSVQCKTDSTRHEYLPPTLEVWGEVSSLTKLGGSGGPGDLLYNPGGKQVGNEQDGSIFPSNFTVDPPE